MTVTRKLRLWLYGLLVLTNLVVGLTTVRDFVYGAGWFSLGLSLAFFVVAGGSGWRFSQTKRMPDDHLGLARPNPLSDPATRNRRLWTRAAWVASYVGLCIVASWYTFVRIDYSQNPFSLIFAALSVFLFLMGVLRMIELLSVWREPSDP
jgi:hypothetical protein